MLGTLILFNTRASSKWIGNIKYLDPSKYIGLGIPTISEAFLQPVGHFDFLIKL